MPLGRFLKVLLGGLLALAILFVLAVGSSRDQVPASLSDYVSNYIGNYAAWEQSAREAFNAALACIMRYAEWLKTFDRDDWLAALTGALVLFTLTLWWSTRRLWKAGNRQAAFAHEMFHAAHRPRLAVRRVGTAFTPDEPVTIEFAIVNAGGAAAASFAWHAAILCLKRVGAIQEVPAFASNAGSSSDAALQAGEARDVLVKEAQSLDPKQLKNIANGAEFLHVIGSIAYKDARGTVRRTGFFRCYDRESRRFRAVDDPEFEYQD